jgi:serine/threonine protein kinase
MMELAPRDPERIGPYRLHARIGAGGMGVVYLASDSSGREVALKLVREELAADPGFRARFAREVRAGQRVGGMCTAHYLDADLDSPRPYLVTEYVAGGNLADYVGSHGPLEGDRLMGLAVGLAEGLVAMGAAGVIHRDLKPSNVLMGELGPKIVDFGISGAADGTSLTQTGAVVGSPSWMAPEQAQGHGTSAPVDVFAWGATVAFAATGRQPFGEGRPDAVIYRVVHEEPDLAGVDPRLASLVAASLSKDPAARPAPEALLVDVIKSATPGAVVEPGPLAEAEATEVVERTWVLPRSRWPNLKSRQIAMGAAAVVLIAAFVAGALYVAHGKNTPSQALKGAGHHTGAQQVGTSSTTSTTATTSAPPLTPANALADIPSCSGCQIIDMKTGLSSPSGPASLVAVQLPGATAGGSPMRFYLIGNNQQVIWSAPSGAPFLANATDGLHFTLDKSGNALMPVSVGAHGGQMVIIRVTPEGITDFGTLTGGDFWSNSPTFLQPTSSGYDQIVLQINNYQPDYADGTTTDNIYSWSTSTDTYVLTNCQVLANGGVPGTTYSPSGGKCGSTGNTGTSGSTGNSG